MLDATPKEIHERESGGLINPANAGLPGAAR